MSETTMGRRVALGRIAGIPIQVDGSWFVLLVFVTWTLATGYFPMRVPGASEPGYWLMGLVAAVLLFSCVLLHELGHSLVAKASGIPVTRVILFIFGGVAQIGGSPSRPLTELKIALAGPLVSLGIAGLCVWLSDPIAVHTMTQLTVWAILRYLALVNIALIVFNLLPGLPLDGGRVLRALLWAWSGSASKATRIAGTLGSGLGVGLLVLGLVSVLRGRWLGGVWYVFLGMFLREAARASMQEPASHV